jgi:hypothetical protein
MTPMTKAQGGQLNKLIKTPASGILARLMTSSTAAAIEIEIERAATRSRGIKLRLCAQVSQITGRSLIATRVCQRKLAAPGSKAVRRRTRSTPHESR